MKLREIQTKEHARKTILLLAPALRERVLGWGCFLSSSFGALLWSFILLSRFSRIEPAEYGWTLERLFLIALFCVLPAGIALSAMYGLLTTGMRVTVDRGAAILERQTLVRFGLCRCRRVPLDPQACVEVKEPGDGMQWSVQLSTGRREVFIRSSSEERDIREIADALEQALRPQAAAKGA